MFLFLAEKRKQMQIWTTLNEFPFFLLNVSNKCIPSGWNTQKKCLIMITAWPSQLAFYFLQMNISGYSHRNYMPHKSVSPREGKTWNHCRLSKTPCPNVSAIWVHLEIVLGWKRIGKQLGGEGRRKTKAEKKKSHNLNFSCNRGGDWVRHYGIVDR